MNNPKKKTSEVILQWLFWISMILNLYFYIRDHGITKSLILVFSLLIFANILIFLFIYTTDRSFGEAFKVLVDFYKEFFNDMFDIFENEERVSNPTVKKSPDLNVHLQLVFNLSILFICLGFFTVLFGVFRSYFHPELVSANNISTISGSIASFIGGTLFLFYKELINRGKD